MPVSDRSIGPRALKQRHPLSAFHLGETNSSGTIKESSSSVRVIDQNDIEKTQSGTVSSGPSRQTANRSGKAERTSFFIDRLDLIRHFELLCFRLETSIPFAFPLALSRRFRRRTSPCVAKNAWLLFHRRRTRWSYRCLPRDW